MSPLITPNELVDELINALQISIDSEIIDPEVIDYDYIPGHSLSVHFKSPVSKLKKDDSLQRFVEMTGATWDDDGTLFIPKTSDEASIALLKDFLLLTRLKPENIKALLRMDSRFHRLALTVQNAGNDVMDCRTVSQYAQLVFERLKSGSLTIRELAEKTGLSMVAISNFKAGRDIRLSNFIKIANALGLKLKLE